MNEKQEREEDQPDYSPLLKKINAIVRKELKKSNRKGRRKNGG
ncbi:MAG: hypothetical protein PXY39_02940 [archaeon]|nr:hypothetical protein [archaeon]